jgi:hypothetical protein
MCDDQIYGIDTFDADEFM